MPINGIMHATKCLYLDVFGHEDRKTIFLFIINVNEIFFCEIFVDEMFSSEINIL